jgi:hypothetical protein
LEHLQGALRELVHRRAPLGLEERVARELAGDHSTRLEGVLGSLVRRAAPPQLDARLVEWIGSQANEPGFDRAPRAEVLRSLDVQQAPDVLERLLNEELDSPERHRVERFSGTLPRLHAPEALTKRLEAKVRRRVWARLLVGPLTALTAAALVLWISQRGGIEPTSGYRFQVHHATSLSGLDPTARALAEALGAGGER